MRNRIMQLNQPERDQDSRRGRRHGGNTDGNGEEENRGRRHHDRGQQEGGRGRHDGRHDGRRSGRHGRRSGGPRGRSRARRGEARTILLDLLRDGPKHGYEMIKTLEERSGGQYVPSPGTVYPTLQYLEDQGLVRAEQEAERRVYQLTEAGIAELDAQAASIADFWAQFDPQPVTIAGQPEVRFLEEELEHLSRIIWSGLRDAIAQDDQPTIRQVREVVEACQTQVRAVIAREAVSGTVETEEDEA
ncbi:MAG: PadR family transcriptional regulator [Caldilineaceae bacterium]